MAEDVLKKDKIPAQLRVKLWLGLEKEEKDWIQMHNNEDVNGAISIYAETVLLNYFILIYIMMI